MFAHSFLTMPKLSGKFGKLGIRRARPRDKSAVLQLVQEHWPSWHDEVLRGFMKNPVSLHIAWDRTRQATVAFACYDTNNTDTGWFGPTGTAPAARGKGIGAVLLKRCLVDIQKQGKSEVTIPWVGPVSFYEHCVDAKICRVFFVTKKT